MVAACLIAPTGAVAAVAPEPSAFVPASLLAAAEAEPQAVFRVIVQGRDRDSAGVATDVAAERARTPGDGRGVKRRFRTISGISAELTGKQILKLAKKRSIGAITLDAPMVPTAGLPPTNTVAPSITGTASEGESLQAVSGSWLGAPPLTLAHQWQRCAPDCADVAGATAASYTLTAADVGATLRVSETAGNADGSASAVSAPTGVVAAVVPAPFVPANTVAPAISGTARQGETLSANEGLWNGSFPLAFAYQWQRCAPDCADVAGAIAATYVLSAEDVGASVRVVVATSNVAGTASATSAASGVVEPPAASPPANTLAPAFAGTAREGETLQAAVGSWDGTSPLAFAYQWQRCAPDCADIAAAWGASYVLSAADVGASVRVVVTAGNAAGSATATSAESGVVDAVAPSPFAPANVVAPAVSGGVREGEALSASEGVWDGSFPLGFAYQWQRCAPDCADVAGATAASYVLSAEDVGASVRVVVTVSNAAGSVSAASAASGVVEALLPVAPANTGAPSLSGSPQEGETLQAAAGSWTGTSPLGFAYQWQRCGEACADIADETGASYVLSAADVGASVRVVVTASNTAGSASAASAASTVAEAPQPSAPTSILAPSVVGNPREGETLSASTGLWSGGSELAFAYQWQRCDTAGEACTDLADATDASYAVTAADVGGRLRVGVTAFNAVGSTNAVSATSAAVEAPASSPANTVVPELSGSAREWETLQATAGSWTGTSPLAFAYQWQRCAPDCTDVADATSSSYTLTAADLDATVRVVVTASNSAGSAAAVSAASAAVQPPLPSPPVDTLAPAVAGTAREGETLQAAIGSWLGTSPLTFAYQWQRCDAAGSACADLADATGASYTLTAADVAATVRVVVTASNAAGFASAASATSAVVEAPLPFAPASTAAPVIAGSAVDGATLTSSAGLWSGDPTTYAYQWQHCDVAGEACTDVAGATGTSYVLAAADVGMTVRVVVTATSMAGSATAASPVSALVAPVPPASISPPLVSGTAEVGATLTSSTGAWSGTAPLTYAYRWERCDAAGDVCADVDGATGSSYTLTAADADATVRVVVSASNAGGSASAPSARSAVFASPPVNVSPPLVSGSAEDGQTLAAAGGSWTGTAPLVFSYQWQRCDALGAVCSDVADATGTTYTLAAADVGSTVRVVVAASNGVDSASQASIPTAPVSAVAPASVVSPTIVGGAEEGLMLTADVGQWTGTAPVTFTYRWQRCSAAGAACGDVGGATNETYLLTTADIGSTAQLVVIATNAAGSISAAAARTEVVTDARVLSGYSTRQLWPYSSGVAKFWKPGGATGPAIAIVDSGIDAGRADFGGRVVEQVTLTTLTPNAPGDGRGHGTFVASIAAGEAVGYTGANPKAKLVSIDVMDDNGRAMTSDVIAAADWIIQNKDLYDIRVANFSLTGSVPSSFRFDPMDKAVEKLWLSGVVVVTPAGNYAIDGQESGVPFTPGNDPFVITVGATDGRGSVWRADAVAAPWSAYGYTVDGFAKPDVGAPGRYMVGAVPPGSRLATERPDRLVAEGYMQLSGTSFAAPIVAGTAAAILAAHPTWTPDQVKGALMLSAQLTAAQPSEAIGVGALNAAGAAAVTDPPNPNQALNQFLIPDPAGGPIPVFDEAAWTATAEADPAWAASHWGSSHWGSAAWSVSHWGSTAWSVSHWGSSHWGSSHWGSSHWGSSHWGSENEIASDDSHWGSATEQAAGDALPAGGYWITSAQRAEAEQALGLVP